MLILYIIYFNEYQSHSLNYSISFSLVLTVRLIYHSVLISSIYIFGRSEGTTLLKYKIPTRGLLGLRNAILTASRGTAILNTIFDSYGPWAGDMNTRDLGSLVMSDYRS